MIKLGYVETKCHVILNLPQNEFGNVYRATKIIVEKNHRSFLSWEFIVESVIKYSLNYSCLMRP